MTFNDAAGVTTAPEVIATGDGSLTLRLPAGEGYKSLAGALTEARHLYLEASGVGARLRAGAACRVLEVGFGTGLNFLVTATLAASTGTPLSYVGLELAPPPVEALESLGYRHLLAPSELPDVLLEWRRALGPAPASGRHDLTHGNTRLSLHVTDARAWQDEDLFDAVYHDAFSPRTNPALWHAGFLARLAQRLRPDGRLVSFTVAGSVRRALADTGLKVTKAPGPPGGKREVLVAAKPT